MFTPASFVLVLVGPKVARLGPYFAQYGYQVRTFTGGRAASAALAMHAAHLVILEIELDDGFAADFVAGNQPRVGAFLLLEDPSRSGHIVSCLARGIDAYVPTPPDQNRLLTTVQRLLTTSTADAVLASLASTEAALHLARAEAAAAQQALAASVARIEALVAAPLQGRPTAVPPHVSLEAPLAPYPYVPGRALRAPEPLTPFPHPDTDAALPARSEIISFDLAPTPFETKAAPRQISAFGPPPATASTSTADGQRAAGGFAADPLTERMRLDLGSEIPTEDAEILPVESDLGTTDRMGAGLDDAPFPVEVTKDDSPDPTSSLLDSIEIESGPLDLAAFGFGPTGTHPDDDRPTEEVRAPPPAPASWSRRVPGGPAMLRAGLELDELSATEPSTIQLSDGLTSIPQQGRRPLSGGGAASSRLPRAAPAPVNVAAKSSGLPRPRSELAGALSALVFDPEHGDDTRGDDDDLVLDIE